MAGHQRQFFTEWRDTGDYPRNVGPSLRLDANGDVSAGGRVLARMPVAAWFRVEIEAAVGKDALRTLTLRLTPPGGAPQTFSDLPVTGRDFHEVHWLGFSSTAATNAVYYLDNVAVGAR